MQCDSPYYTQPNGYLKEIPLPCGKCPPCKKRRINGWAFRLMEEDKVSSSSYFITLTFSTDHVPITNNGFMTLEKSKWQNFMKRLRKLQPNKLRYYTAGEYGDKRDRPHYHSIMFNLTGCYQIGVNELGNPLYANNDVNESWPWGAVEIQGMNKASCSYVAKYIDKLKRIPRHKNDDRQPEKSYMSQGIGKNYINKSTIKYHKEDLSRMYVTLEGGYKTAMPKYFKDKIFTEAEKKSNES